MSSNNWIYDISLTVVRVTRSKITREKFEELCEDLWEKSLIPLKKVLEHSGLKVEDVYAVELIGGATRVPRLQVFTNWIPMRLKIIY